MAVGFRAAGTVANNTTEPVTVTQPAGAAAGDMGILVCTSKAATPPTVNQPTGWNTPSDSTTTGGAGSAGIDTGPNRVAVFWREFVAGDGNVSVDYSAAGSPMQCVILNFTKDAAETWDAPVCATSSDTSGSTTSYDPAAAGTTIDLGSGDWLGVGTAINGDAGTPTVPGTLTVAGVTLGTANSRVNAGTNAGNDGRVVVDDAPYSSGTASAGPDYSIAYSGANASMAGCSVFFRLRVSGATAKTLTDSGSATDTLQVNVAVTLTETGTAADTLSVAAAVALTETGTGADAIQVSIPRDLGDSGSGADQLTVTAAVPLAEVAGGTDTLSVAAQAAATDTGAAGDALQVAAAVSLSDLAAAAESAAAAVLVALADQSAAADTLDVSQGAAAPVVWAVSTATDQLAATGAAAIQSATSGTATDQLAATGEAAIQPQTTGDATLQLAAIGEGQVR